MGFGMQCCLSIIIMLCATTVIYGVEEQAATGARAIGIGGAFIGVADDENAVRRNPAGLTRLDRYAVGFEQTPSGLFNALETNYLSAVLPTSEKMALGIDWLQVGIEDEELNSNRSSFNFAYSYAPFSLLSLGANLKYFTWSIALDGRSRGAATGWGTDIGILLHPHPRWKLGVVAQDFVGFGSGEGLSTGTWIRHDSDISEKIFPTAYKLGIAYRPVSDWLISADLTDRLQLGTEFLPNRNFAIRAGFQKDLYTSEPPTYSLGGRVRYKWMDFNVAYLIPPTLPPTVYAGLSLNFDFRKLPVLIEEVRIRDLYPVLYRYYARPNLEVKTEVLPDDATPPVFTEADREYYYPLEQANPIGRIWLKNESNKPITVHIKLFIPEFVSKKGTEVASSDIDVPENKRISVPIQRLVLSQKVRELSQNQPVEAQIRVIESGGSAYRTFPVTFSLHDNHSIQLDDVAKLACFISSESSAKDSAIGVFINQVRTAFQTEINSADMPENLYVAMLLFNVLHGVSYAPDPNIPRESGSIDEIKYPHEMLESLMGPHSGDDGKSTFGDCDDSTVLYCSLLESVGIKTALIQLTSHVLMAFDLGNISVEQAQEMGLPNDYYKTVNGQAWIPIETTLINQGFAAAWQWGAESLQAVNIRAETVEDAWEKYGESSLPGQPARFSIPKDRIQNRIDVDLATPWIREFFNALSDSAIER